MIFKKSWMILIWLKSYWTSLILARLIPAFPTHILTTISLSMIILLLNGHRTLNFNSGQVDPSFSNTHFNNDFPFYAYTSFAMVILVFTIILKGNFYAFSVFCVSLGLREFPWYFFIIFLLVFFSWVIT